MTRLRSDSFEQRFMLWSVALATASGGLRLADLLLLATTGLAALAGGYGLGRWLRRQQPQLPAASDPAGWPQPRVVEGVPVVDYPDGADWDEWAAWAKWRLVRHEREGAGEAGEAGESTERDALDHAPF